MTRNFEILKTIEDGQIPVLPFELEIARDSMAKLTATQKELSEDLGDAMNQSSETWHDNAPAEAISSRSLILAESAKPHQRLLKNGVPFEYSNDNDEVTLGSVVSVQTNIDPSKDMTKYILTGATLNLPEDILSLQNTNEITAITLSSPIGRAILGAKVGDDISFNMPRGRKSNIRICNIESIVDPTAK
ncbi:hypothetical protein CR983_00775 [Candidatus Saccharibacteria bacterium]|nr:MAG: hypothetical protein CR983_00775 [Candidatus Saccharibacteria bacterium]